MFGLGKKKQPQRIEMPDVAAEYAYVQQLTCESCHGPTSSQRTGGSGPEDGHMIDHWLITCKRCGKTRQVDLSVPEMDISALLGSLGKKND